MMTLTETQERVGCAQVWKLRTGQVLRRYEKAHALGVTSLRFGRDGTQLLSGSFDTTLKCASLFIFPAGCDIAQLNLVMDAEFTGSKAVKH